MKKTAVFILLICYLVLCFCACTPTDESPNYLPLYDENGNYLEENVGLNLALEKKNGLALIRDGNTEYKIVYAETTNSHILTAIDELKKFFDKNGNGIQAVADDTAQTSKEIVIGLTNRNITKYTLEKTGSYYIACKDDMVYIYAENEYGITNGIYGFMEDYLGCFFLNEDSTYYPTTSTVILETGEQAYTPAFDRRDVGEYSTWHSENFTDKMRIRTQESFEPDGCHHSLGMIAQDILDQHPEYYAEIDGVRRTGDYLFQGPQLCFSNPEVINLLEQAVLQKASEYQGMQEVWWDISQCDSMNYCHCEQCTEIATRLQNPAGPIYECVNTIAKRHPDMKFSTLAYHYGSTPPVNIEFADNVMIKWCIMSSYGKNDYSAPIEEQVSDIAVKQYNEIVGWSKLAKHIYVWDYITDFFYYPLPFPCFDAMAGNIKLLASLGIDGVFSLGSYNYKGGYLDEMKANYASHLLWNPDIDKEQFLSKFATLYYGKESALYMLAMFDRMQETVDSPLWVYAMPFTHEEDYLSEENMDYYFECLATAMEKASANETYLKRLRYDKMCLVYSYYSLGYGTTEKQNAMREELITLCQEFDISSFNEINSSNLEDLVGK